MTALEKLDSYLDDEVDNYSQSEKLVELSSAKTKILLKRYGTPERIPTNIDDSFDNNSVYTDLQARLALILINRIGAEGEDAHNEGDIARSYTAEVKLLDEIPTYGYVAKNIAYNKGKFRC